MCYQILPCARTVAIADEATKTVNTSPGILESGPISTRMQFNSYDKLHLYINNKNKNESCVNKKK